jgi:type I restriction enzyme S subunit
MEMRPGYKPSDVGPIPVAWEARRLGEIAVISSGGTPSRENPGYWNGSIPWITTSQIDFNEISEAGEYITDAGLNNSAAKLLPPGTLLMALYGQGKTRGKVGVLTFEAATNQACASIAVSARVSGEFVRFFLTNRYDAIRSASNGGSQDNLSGQIVKNLPVALPPLREQKAIAGALSDVDALLGALDRLIAKKCDLKQAAMQQLLTGQTRLPGFTGKWESKRLGELGSFSKGKGIRKDDVQSDGLPCIRYGEIYTRHTDVIREFYSFITPGVAKESCRLTSGDIVFACSGETAAEIGKCVAYLGDEEAYVGGDTVLLHPTAQDSTFLGYLLNTPIVAEQKARMGQGDAVVHISARNLAALRVAVPSLSEQAAIAQVFTEMDTELAALEQRRDKTRLLKQGMMQELLTGKTRLV